jgi:hypothetical protein
MRIEQICFERLEERSSSDRWGRGDQKRDRRVFYDSRRKLFLKVWDPSFEHHNRFLCGNVTVASGMKGLFGFDIGFFNKELCTAFVELITDQDGNCRGYIAREGSPLETRWNEKLAEFTALVENATKRTGYAHSDYCYNNLVRIDGGISFIDFDTLLTNVQFAIRSFEEKVGSLRAHVYKPYRDFVSDLLPQE